MRQRLFNNHILARAQATFVALLYVFLCTFGTLTHAHAPGDAHAQGHVGYVGSAHQAVGHFISVSSRHVLTASPHCAFCDWQANSVALTVLPLRLSAPCTFACVYARREASVTLVLLVRASSRAPPSA